MDSATLDMAWRDSTEKHLCVVQDNWIWIVLGRVFFCSSSPKDNGPSALQQPMKRLSGEMMSEWNGRKRWDVIIFHTENYALLCADCSLRRNKVSFSIRKEREDNVSEAAERALKLWQKKQSLGGWRRSASIFSNHLQSSWSGSNLSTQKVVVMLSRLFRV